MTTSQPNRVDLALDYAARGWAVLPLHHIERGKCSCGAKPGGCRVGKHPRTANGVHDATIDPATVRAWWRQWPLANIGIATGAVSSLVVLDVDGDDARRVLDEAMRSMGVGLPETLTVRTGDGWHHYFTIPSGLAVKSHKAINEISLQADNVYAVGPGSIHETGRLYSWEHHPDDRTLAAAPEWLLGSRWRSVVKRLWEAPGKPKAVAWATRSAPLGDAKGDGVGSASLCFASPTPKPTCKDQEDHEDEEDEEDHGWYGDTPESLIAHVPLTAAGQTDTRLYRLVRGLKLDLGLDLANGLPWVRAWHQRNAQHIQHEVDWLVMEEKAMRAWATAKIPLKCGAHMHAANLARVGQPMPEEEKYAGSPSAQLAVRIIANLQAIAPDLPFLLSQRQLAEALGHSQHDSARFIIQKLQRDNLLECTHPGTRGANGLAAKWRYRGTLPSTASTPTPQENFAESPK